MDTERGAVYIHALWDPLPQTLSNARVHGEHQPASFPRYLRSCSVTNIKMTVMAGMQRHMCSSTLGITAGVAKATMAPLACQSWGSVFIDLIASSHHRNTNLRCRIPFPAGNTSISTIPVHGDELIWNPILCLL